jgi:peptidoglycan/LPS O-acetylase OafA/YrhL
MNSATQNIVQHKPYYAAIDGVRAVCVLLVMMNHVHGGGQLNLVPEPHLGVDIFFIISGFLITSLLRLEQRQTGSVDFGAFYWRRGFRILPVYFAVLLLYVGVCHLPGFSEKWTQLKGGMPWFLTFMNEYAVEPLHGNVFTHTWSLGIEEKFYLLWPVLFFLLARTMRARVMLMLALFCLLSLLPGTKRFYAGAYYGLLMGAIMAVALSSSYYPKIVGAVRRIPAAVVLVLFVSSFWLEHWTGSVMLGFSALIVLFLTHLVVAPSWLARLLGSRVMVWLGKRSYSMYLVHILCLNAIEGRAVFQRPGGVVAILALAYLLTALVAEAFYRLIEEPSRTAGKRFLASRQTRRQNMVHSFGVKAREDQGQG